MRKRFAAGLLAAALGALALVPTGASAATEFGDSCVANDTVEAPITFVESSAPGNPLPTAAPVSGVLTHWRTNVIPVPFAIPATMKVLRLNAATLTASVVGEATGAALSGSNTFPVRLPIQAGDYLGISGGSQVGALICETAVDSGLVTMLNAGPGNSVPYEAGSGEIRVPLVGVIEPDVDGDGYGDESQDGCPQSA
ncbi:MAG TPA: hypothetical protein VFB52_02050, partial [Solirubrobacterales bacterium]|nr:hypothetical protein [Solirubrobacterales bacterium]